MLLVPRFLVGSGLTADYDLMYKSKIFHFCLFEFGIFEAGKKLTILSSRFSRPFSEYGDDG